MVETAARFLPIVLTRASRSNPRAHTDKAVFKTTTIDDFVIPRSAIHSEFRAIVRNRPAIFRGACDADHR